MALGSRRKSKIMVTENRSVGFRYWGAGAVVAIRCKMVFENLRLWKYSVSGFLWWFTAVCICQPQNLQLMLRSDSFYWYKWYFNTVGFLRKPRVCCSGQRSRTLLWPPSSPRCTVFWLVSIEFREPSFSLYYNRFSHWLILTRNSWKIGFTENYLWLAKVMMLPLEILICRPYVLAEWLNLCIGCARIL